MIKLVSMDLDYTLLNSHHMLSDEQIPWLRKMAQKHILVLASGRPLHSMMPIAERMGPDVIAWLISDNGAHCVSMEGQNFFEAHMSPEDFRYIVDTAMRMGVHPHYYDSGVIRAFYDSPFLRRDSMVTGLPFEIEPDIDLNLKGRNLRKAIVMGEPGKMKDFYQKMLERESLNPILSKPYFMEIPPAGVDKGFTLERLSESLGLTSKQVMAVGDSLNDVGMVRYAGLGLAMENGSVGLKQVADHVLKIHHDQVLAKYLYRILEDPKRLQEYSYDWKEMQ